MYNILSFYKILSFLEYIVVSVYYILTRSARRIPKHIYEAFWDVFGKKENQFGVVRMEEEREGVGGGGKVGVLIRKATHSTEPEVDPSLLKAIKMVVRYSDSELRVAAHTLMDHMKHNHAQVLFPSHYSFLSLNVFYFYFFDDLI